MHIAARMATQRGLGLFAAQTRGAQSSRDTVEAGKPRWWLGMCSGSTDEQSDRLARDAFVGTSRSRASRPSSASRDPVFGGKLQTKSGNPENACGFVEITPGLYHHAKGSCWAHSRGRWERFVNTYGTEVVVARKHKDVMRRTDAVVSGTHRALTLGCRRWCGAELCN